VLIPASGPVSQACQRSRSPYDPDCRIEAVSEDLIRIAPFSRSNRPHEGCSRERGRPAHLEGRRTKSRYSTPNMAKLELIIAQSWETAMSSSGDYRIQRFLSVSPLVPSRRENLPLPDGKDKQIILGRPICHANLSAGQLPLLLGRTQSTWQCHSGHPRPGILDLIASPVILCSSLGSTISQNPCLHIRTNEGTRAEIFINRVMDINCLLLNDFPCNGKIAK
jgi:hypothetical protein